MLQPASPPAHLCRCGLVRAAACVGFGVDGSVGMYARLGVRVHARLRRKPDVVERDRRAVTHPTEYAAGARVQR